MLTNFSALFWLSNVLPFSMVKSVRDFAWKCFDSRYFILRNTLQRSYFFKGLHYCEKISEKSGQII